MNGIKSHIIAVRYKPKNRRNQPSKKSVIQLLKMLLEEVSLQLNKLNFERVNKC